MKSSIFLSVLILASYVFSNENKTYEEILLRRIFDNRSYIKQICEDCYKVSVSSEWYTDSCPFENKQLFINLLDSSFKKWKNYQNKVIKTFYSLRGTNFLLRTEINNSKVINDSVYVYILAGYLGLSDVKIKNETINLLLDHTAYIQLQKNSDAIKVGIKAGVFDRDYKEKKKRLKLLALLKLSKREKADILRENLFAEKEKQDIEKRIKKAKMRGDKVNREELIRSLYNNAMELPVEIKARLGSDSAIIELIKYYEYIPTEDNFRETAKKIKDFGFKRGERLVEALLYVGADTCMKHLILRFNAPIYKYRSTVTGGLAKSATMRKKIITGLRRHFPDDTLINKTFDETMTFFDFDKWSNKNMRYEEVKKQLKDKMGDYLNKFNEWAYVKFGVKTSEPDLPVGINNF